MGKIEEKSFGNTDGKEVKIFTLTSNNNGSKVELICYGATWKSWEVKDKNGKFVDIVLGYDTLEGYLTGRGYLGQTVGRVCNRIRGGRFTLDGQEYTLATNNGPNHLHGGVKNFSKKVWDAKVDNDRNAVEFSYRSEDGEEGYPGTVTARVTYQLTEDNAVEIHYSATTTKRTPINLTNHAYFNLAGEGATSIFDHDICIAAETYMPADEIDMATGELKSVENSPYDLRKPLNIGDIIKAMGHGFDNNYCVNAKGTVKNVTSVFCPATGIKIEISSDQNGIQFYTANKLDQIGKGGKPYKQYCSLCLETQGYPDAVNNVNFPSIFISPGETYKHNTTYRSSTKHSCWCIESFCCNTPVMHNFCSIRWFLLRTALKETGNKKSA